MAREQSEGQGNERLTLTAVVAGLSVVLTIVILLFIYYPSRTPPNAPIKIFPPPPTPTLSPLNIHVSGAVNRPGVVEVSPGARVQDAITAAGGPAADADLESTNLAAPLLDGQHLRIPAVGESTTPVSQPEQAGAAIPLLININSATAEELTALPGVGQATAAKIVAYRQEHGPFTQIEKIMDVSGIGEGKFNGFKEMITVGP